MVVAEYHGFGKARLPDDLLREVLTPHGLTPDEVQVEVVKVERDLSDEVHYHARSVAYVVALGSEDHFSDPPLRGRAFVNGRWQRFEKGDELTIPPGTPHGFTVWGTGGGRGTLYFLSVQSPPIVGPREEDDYHRISVDPI